MKKIEDIISNLELDFLLLEKQLSILTYLIDEFVNEEYISNELLELFKKLQYVDLSSKKAKVIWQSNLKLFRHQLKLKENDVNVEDNKIEERNNLAVIRKDLKKIETKPKPKFEEISEKNQKLGIVKYIHEDNSHGYIIPFDSFDEVYQRNFLSGNGAQFRSLLLEKYMLVQFVLGKDRKGRLNATKISKALDILVVQNYAYILLEGYYSKSIVFSNKIDTGFYKVNILYAPGNEWSVFVLGEFAKEKKKKFLPKIFKNLASNYINKELLYSVNDLLNEFFTKDEILNILKESIIIEEGIDEKLLCTYKGILEKHQLSLEHAVLNLDSLDYTTYFLLKKYNISIDAQALITKNPIAFESNCEKLENTTLLELFFRLAAENVEAIHLLTIIELLKSKKILLREEKADDFIRIIDRIKGKIPEFSLEESDFDKKITTTILVSLFKAKIIVEISDDAVSKYLKEQKSIAEKLNFIISSEEAEFASKLLEGLKLLKIDISTEENEGAVFELLPQIKEKYPEVIFNEHHFYSRDSDDFIKLLQAGFIIHLSEEKVVECINDKKLKGQQLFDYILKLPVPNLLKYIDKYPELKDLKDDYVLDRIAAVIDDNISYLSFDIESDGNKIHELAFITNEGKYVFNQGQVEEGILKLKEAVSESKIIVGQNIKKFDLEILAKFGLSVDLNLVWDTLEVEFLLNPCRKSYALNTQHTALYDAEQSLDLFKNQLLRLLKLDNASILSFFPPIIDYKSIDSKLVEWSYTNIDWEEASLSFFRKINTVELFDDEEIKTINKVISNETLNIVFAPQMLYAELIDLLPIYFTTGDYSILINNQKVADFEDDFQRAILERYLALRGDKKLLPYWQNLPVAIRLFIGEENKARLCEGIDEELFNYSIIQSIGFKNKQISKETYEKNVQDGICKKISLLCVEPTSNEQLDFFAATKPNIIVIGQDLSLITNKYQLDVEIEISTLYEKLKGNSLLLRMSGGRNYLKLTNELMTALGLNWPELAATVWLENERKGLFRAYYSIDLDSVLNKLQHNSLSHSCVDLDLDLENNKNLYIVRTDEQRSGYIASERRLNPETLQRAMYWTYQFRLMSSLSSRGTNVLLVNEKDEIAGLEGLAKKHGYYVPHEDASLGRRIELLQQSKNSKKLLIASVLDLPNIIKNNDGVHLDIFWDSFLLREKEVILGDNQLHNLVARIDGEDDELLNTEGGAQDAKFDIFKLLKIHKPLIAYYNFLINQNNAASNLYLIDPRLMDYFGIETLFGGEKIEAVLWKDEKAYNKDLKLASTYFKHQGIANVDVTNLLSIKDMLRDVFLRVDDKSQTYEWRDYQHLYLDAILPASQDLIISLPTGAGKSLLFQAPALYRSSFTHKLTIVVTPLRALMRDQVEALWSKGFYSNVDFLSGDKSTEETKDIYRRIAGGEITLLFITPERFRSQSFENTFLVRLEADNGLEYVVFDEAHCISQWGQEFRPDYLNAAAKIAELFGVERNFKACMLLFSATISQQVLGQIQQLLPSISTIKGADMNYNPIQDHIQINFNSDFDEENRLAAIAAYLKDGNFRPNLSKALVFINSRKGTEEAAIEMPEKLKAVYDNDCEFADKVNYYHASMDAEERTEVYEKFKNNEISILFATKAFGMGMDIPDIHYIAHLKPPTTFEDFLQEIGRAGRDAEMRKNAGFSIQKPIESLCLVHKDDFAKAKDRLHKNRLTWVFIKDAKVRIEEYIAKFLQIKPNMGTPVAIPFNLYSMDTDSPQDKDTLFRLAMHWLEKLGRIKLGYFAIAQLEFSKESLEELITANHTILEKEVENTLDVLKEIYQSIKTNSNLTEQVSIPIAQMRAKTKYGVNKLIRSLLKAEHLGLVEMVQMVKVEHTLQRTAELTHLIRDPNFEPPALKIIFELAKTLLSQVKAKDSNLFAGNDLQDSAIEAIANGLTGLNTAFISLANGSNLEKSLDGYKEDIQKKRIKHVFTILRILKEVKIGSKFPKPGEKEVQQSIFNGYAEDDKWKFDLGKLYNDCCKLLRFVSSENIQKNTKIFKWKDLLN